MGFIKVDQIGKTYGAGAAAVSAITDMSFEIESGEFVSIMGESGAGKSTLLSVLGGMNTPTTGAYEVDDMDVYALHSEQRADFRREYLGFVFQSFHLVEYLTVIENVLLPLTVQKISRKEKREMAMEALENVGLADKAHRLPSQISGGEQERVVVRLFDQLFTLFACRQLDGLDHLDPERLDDGFHKSTS